MNNPVKLTLTAAAVCITAAAYAEPVQTATVTREFFAAVGARDFDRAGKLVVSDRYPKEKLQKLRESLRVEDAKLQESYVGREQAAVVTGEIAPRHEGRGRTGRWGISLRKQGEGWLIRDLDFLPNDEALQNYLAGFRKVEPDAQKVAVTP